MNSKARFQLNNALQSKPMGCIAVKGDPDACENLVREECAKLQLECEPFVNVPTMATLEEIHRHQRENTVIREGNADRPTFISSFLAANGFQQMPKVLVLSGFNGLPSTKSYFLKGLLDEMAREEDDCYNQLLAIILIMAPDDAPDVFDIDPDISGCISVRVNTRD